MLPQPVPVQPQKGELTQKQINMLEEWDPSRLQSLQRDTNANINNAQPQRKGPASKQSEAQMSHTPNPRTEPSKTQTAPETKAETEIATLKGMTQKQITLLADWDPSRLQSLEAADSKANIENLPVQQQHDATVIHRGQDFPVLKQRNQNMSRSPKPRHSSLFEEWKASALRNEVKENIAPTGASGPGSASAKGVGAVGEDVKSKRANTNSNGKGGWRHRKRSSRNGSWISSGSNQQAPTGANDKNGRGFHQKQASQSSATATSNKPSSANANIRHSAAATSHAQKAPGKPAAMPAMSGPNSQTPVNQKVVTQKESPQQPASKAAVSQKSSQQSVSKIVVSKESPRHCINTAAVPQEETSQQPASKVAVSQKESLQPPINKLGEEQGANGHTNSDANQLSRSLPSKIPKAGDSNSNDANSHANDSSHNSGDEASDIGSPGHTTITSNSEADPQSPRASVAKVSDSPGGKPALSVATGPDTKSRGPQFFPEFPRKRSEEFVVPISPTTGKPITILRNGTALRGRGGRPQPIGKQVPSTMVARNNTPPEHASSRPATSGSMAPTAPKPEQSSTSQNLHTAPSKPAVSNSPPTTQQSLRSHSANYDSKAQSEQSPVSKKQQSSGVPVDQKVSKQPTVTKAPSTIHAEHGSPKATTQVSNKQQPAGPVTATECTVSSSPSTIQSNDAPLHAMKGGSNIIAEPNNKQQPPVLEKHTAPNERMASTGSSTRFSDPSTPPSKLQSHTSVQSSPVINKQQSSGVQDNQAASTHSSSRNSLSVAQGSNTRASSPHDGSNPKVFDSPKSSDNKDHSSGAEKIYTAPNGTVFSSAELSCASKGVKIENDRVYFRPSFVNDPWKGARLVKLVYTAYWW